MFESLIPATWGNAVAAMDPFHFWFLTLLAIVAALAGFYGIFRFLHRARLIEDLPTSKVRSAAQGYVELEGLAELLPGEPIHAPITGSRCVWFSYKVEERANNGTRSGGKWRVIEKGTSHHIFRLVDDSGECIIDPEGAVVIPAAREVWYSRNERRSMGMMPPTKGWTRHLTTGRYRYTEQRIHAADDLHAIGWFTTGGGSQELPNTEVELRALLMQWKRDQAMLHERFDANGDGVIDVHEWDQVRREARREVLRDQAERQRRPPYNLLRKPADGRTFLLSTLPQEHLSQRYRRYAFLALALFLLGGSLASWLLAVHVTFR